MAFTWLAIIALLILIVIRAAPRVNAERAVTKSKSLTDEEYEKHLEKTLNWVIRFEKQCEDRISQHRWLNREFRQKWIRSMPKGSFPSDRKIAGTSEWGPLSASQVSTLREIWELGVIGYCARLNDMLMSAEREYCGEFFQSIEKSPLTEEQIDASICFENRVNVIAAAGSGKTSVMVAKAGYAIHRELVEPENVLLLAFNKDAADELRQRVNQRLSRFGIDTSKIEVTTFHAFGLRMIGEISGKKPRVAEWVSTRSKEIEKADEIISNLRASDKDFALNWALLKTLFTRDFSQFGEEETTDYWDPQTRKTGKRTLNDEVVKSEEERLIADWLYLNGVPYRYESDYEFDTRSAQRSQYRPDFYYPEIDVYHEHFALNQEGDPPSTFKGYLDGVVWKRAAHKQFGTKLFETTSAEIRSRAPFDRLEKMFSENNQTLNFDPDRPYNGRKPVDNRLIINNLLTFLSHAKNARATVSDIRSKLSRENSDSWLRHSIFVEVYEKFYLAWQSALESEGVIDFHDMLCQASDLLKSSGAKKEYDLILVDEFQDSSISRMQLTRALADRSGVQLTVVGDDWQSINRFAGADITIATAFSEYFGESVEFQLTRTFRCPAEICDISSNFVMRNEQQIKKKVIGNPNTRVAHVTIQFAPTGIDQKQTRALRVEALNQVLTKIALDEHREGNDVLVLGRYNFEIKDLPAPNDVTRVLSVKKSTIHSSKGSEASHVVVVGMDSDSKYGFPSAVDDDPVFGLVMPKADAYAFAEERRLFYVALTRAKESVCLIGNESTPSRFLAELTKDFGVQVLSTDNPTTVTRHCPRCNGILVKKTNRQSGIEFLGCQQFPQCKYAESISASEPPIQPQSSILSDSFTAVASPIDEILF